MIVCVRGATTVEADEKELIYEAVTEMMREIIDANHIRTEDIASIVFTATNDLKSAYPAVAVRNMGITEPALMCETYTAHTMDASVRSRPRKVQTSV